MYTIAGDFVNFLANAFDKFYQFLVAFSNQVVNATESGFPFTPINLFWFLVVANLILIPILRFLPRYIDRQERISDVEERRAAYLKEKARLRSK